MYVDVCAYAYSRVALHGFFSYERVRAARDLWIAKAERRERKYHHTYDAGTYNYRTAAHMRSSMR